MVVSQFSFTVNGNFKLAINLILEIEMCLAGHLIRCCYFTLAIEINVIKSLKPQWNCDSNPFILKFLICQSAKLTVLTNPVRHFYELSLGSNSWNNCRTRDWQRKVDYYQPGSSTKIQRILRFLTSLLVIEMTQGHTLTSWFVQTWLRFVGLEDASATKGPPACKTRRTTQEETNENIILTKVTVGCIRLFRLWPYGQVKAIE